MTIMNDTEDYVFGQGSVFQILDDMEALRKERELSQNKNAYSIDSNNTYKEETFSSPEHHMEVCGEGESDAGAYKNDNDLNDPYADDAYSLNQGKLSPNERRKYLKQKYGNSEEYKKAKGIDFSSEKEQYPQSRNPRRYGNNDTPAKKDETKLNNKVFVIFLSLSFIFPEFALAAGIFISSVLNDKRGKILIIISVFSFIFRIFSGITG